MDNLDQPQSVQRSDAPGLEQECASLRHLIVSVLVLLLIVSGTFNIFLFRQYRAVSKEFAPMRGQMAQIMSECNKINSVATEFAKRALEFSKTHPDFAPVLSKYNISAITPTSAPPAVAVPGSAPAVPQKK